MTYTHTHIHTYMYTHNAYKRAGPSSKLQQDNNGDDVEQRQIQNKLFHAHRNVCRRQTTTADALSSQLTAHVVVSVGSQIQSQIRQTETVFQLPRDKDQVET